MQDSRRNSRAWAACALLTLTATSCRSPVRDLGVTAVQFEDVFVPSKMQLRADNHQSHSTEALEASYRHGHFEYTGTSPVDEISEDVLRRMPQHNWNLVEDRGDSTDRSIRFDRGSHSVSYHVFRKQAVTRLVIDYRTDQP